MAMIWDSDMEDEDDEDEGGNEEEEEEQQNIQMPTLSSFLNRPVCPPLATTATVAESATAEATAEASAVDPESCIEEGVPPDKNVLTIPHAVDAPTSTTSSLETTAKTSPVLPTLTTPQSTSSHAAATDHGSKPSSTKPATGVAKTTAEVTTTSKTVAATPTTSPSKTTTAEQFSKLESKQTFPSSPSATSAETSKPKFARTVPAKAPQQRVYKAAIKDASSSHSSEPMRRTMSTTFTPDKFGVAEHAFLHSLSRHGSVPAIRFPEKTPSPLWFTNSNPAPGSYKLMDGSRLSKYTAPAVYSMPIAKRLRPPPDNMVPEPGAYDTSKLERIKYPAQPTSSFGSAPRGRPNPIRQFCPGPGTYDVQSNPSKDCRSFSIQGKFRKRGILNRDDPGPGAYDPSAVLCEPTPPKAGIGTATRKDYIVKVDNNGPGPGAYDVHNKRPETLKFSMTSRRMCHDFSSYLTPGPGMYTVATSFGY